MRHIFKLKPFLIHSITFSLLLLINYSCNDIKSEEECELICNSNTNCLSLSLDLLKTGNYHQNKLLIKNYIDSTNNFWLYVSALNDLQLKDEISALKTLSLLEHQITGDCGEWVVGPIKRVIQSKQSYSGYLNSMIELSILNWDSICNMTKPDSSAVVTKSELEIQTLKVR